MSDQAFRAAEDVVEAQAEPDFVNNLVCVFGIDVVFESLRAGLFKVLWRDLYEIRNGNLSVMRKCSVANRGGNSL